MKKKHAGMTQAGAFLALGLFLAAPARAQDAPDKVALLVGIDHYAHGTAADFPDLSGCVNDVQRVEELLVSRFGFAPENIRTLVNEEATLANIVGSFEEWLIERAGKKTQALFWYSGHGSRVPDRSGQELEHLDSSFVAYDSRTGDRDGSYDFSDDMLQSLVYELCRRTPNVTIVTDSCHSGGGVRGAEAPLPHRGATAGTQPVDWSAFEAFWPQGVKQLEDGGGEELPSQSYVHIAACSPRQLAQEIRVEDPAAPEGSRVHGALTFFLTEALASAQPSTTFARVADDAAVRLATRFPGQTVWYEGAVDKKLFGAEFEERPPGYLARVQPDGGLLVGAGSIHGLRKGAVLEVFDARGDTSLGLCEVVHVATAACIAKWQDASAARPADVLQGALRAVENERPGGSEPLRVHTDDPALAALAADSRSASVTVGTRSADAYWLATEDGRLTLRAPDGQPIWREQPGRDETSPDRRAKLLARALESELSAEARYRTLNALGEERGDQQLAARFRAPTAEEFARYGDFLDATDSGARNPDGRQAAGGEWTVVGGGLRSNRRLIMLEVENTLSEPMYVSVVSVAEDRSRNVVWPYAGRRDNQLEPGQKIPVPVQIVANEDWELDRPMRDRYLVIATQEYADFRPFQRQSSITRGAEEAEMPKLLAEAVAGPQTRGRRIRVADTKSDWGITVVDLLVVKP